jgi:hypothetical protein
MTVSGDFFEATCYESKVFSALTFEAETINWSPTFMKGQETLH